MGDALQPVVEIDENLIQREHGVQHDASDVQRVGVIHHPALFHDQGENVAHRVIRNDDRGANRRLLDFEDGPGIRHVHRVVDFEQVAAMLHDLVDDARIRGNDLHVVLTADSLLDNLHVEQPEEAAAEAKPERERTF